MSKNFRLVTFDSAYCYYQSTRGPGINQLSPQLPWPYREIPEGIEVRNGIEGKNGVETIVVWGVADFRGTPSHDPWAREGVNPVAFPLPTTFFAKSAISERAVLGTRRRVLTTDGLIGYWGLYWGQGRF